MSVREHAPPAVPLEAALGPDNPPCPACGEPLFGWLQAPWDPGLRAVRCESCGLAAIGDPGDAGEVRRELAQARVAGEGAPVGNRSSLAAWIGRGAWAPLEPGARYLLTPAALRHLDVPGAGGTGRVTGPDIPFMWQTLLNSFTFGRNLALAQLGRGVATRADKPWQRRVDAAITVLAGAPLLVVAAALELGAAAAGRGGALRPSARQ